MVRKAITAPASTACSHPPEQIDRSRYVLDGRRAMRIEKCERCGRIVRRVRSRWKSRGDRRLGLQSAHTSRRQRYGSQYNHRAAEARERTAAARKRKRDPVLRLLTAMQECEQAAKDLPQEDDRLWKYHPVARRWRRLMRAWWALAVTGRNMRAPVEEIPRTLRGSLVGKGGTIAGDLGAAPDAQHGRAAKIAKLKAMAVEVAPGRYVIDRVGCSYQFTLYGEQGEQAQGEQS